MRNNLKMIEKNAANFLDEKDREVSHEAEKIFKNKDKFAVYKQLTKECSLL